MLDRLIETDDRDHVAVGAERGGFAIGTREGLGVARFIRLADQPDTAEMAVAVIDDLQGRGLGRLLVQVLCGVARDRGVRRFRALVLPDNLAMQELIHELDPAAEIGSEDGVRTFTLLVPDVDLETIGATSSHGLLTFGLDLLAHRLRGLNPLTGWDRFAGEETRAPR
jgi:GNAT superfamily N-acetyltransferase